MVRAITGVSGPLNRSPILNDVPAGVGETSNRRTPRKSPSGMPPVHVIPCSSSATVTGKARPGETSLNTLIVPPSTISPSTRTTPLSHRA